MKAVISSLLFTAAAVANAANCDVSVLTALSKSADAGECNDVSNFAVPVESTVNTIVTNLESFCGNGACLRVLAALGGIDECSVAGSDLHQTVVGPIAAVCSSTRALRAADGSHVHSSGMDMGSASVEAEDSHDTASASSEAYDSHDTAGSTSASAVAGDDDAHDSHDTTSSTASSKSTTTGSSTSSKATSSNSTSSTQAPNATGTSSAQSITVAAGSVFLAAAAAFF
ncbi:hypothetical protein PHYPSEUDO_010298 [Phytophthora pseudosyringae]|uniref:Elicitin n=1 Tax=Phytophthora pseudosyringae TaxID=221518 RepID=A0A8T1VFL3_9STRA|nr:hypothetical protein PHYPSEUDO_010298 [Phytophthora pseudosyringae]